MKLTFKILVIVWGLASLWGCSESPTQEGVAVVTDVPEKTENEDSSRTLQEGGELADVVSVGVSGQAGAYRFSVGVRSPDQGCDQYADWWEVVGQDGELVYRRVLLHSHTNEQPFERSGGPVDIQSDTVVWVRAHMNPGGYGGQAFRGSVASGFEPAPLEAGFAADLAGQPPLPQDCAF